MSNRLPILAVEIRKAHADVQDAAKTAAERAIAAGHALIEAKGLVQHGQWLPWLREHCALAERTAQVYMKIAKSGLKSADVAVLGLNAATKAITLEYPDPFADDPEEALQEWSIWSLWLLRRGDHVENVERVMQQMRRTGWRVPSEFYSAEGDKYCARYGMRRVTEKTKAEFAAFLAENRPCPREDIEAECLAIADAQPELPPQVPLRRRRRRAA